MDKKDKSCFNFLKECLLRYEIVKGKCEIYLGFPAAIFTSLGGIPYISVALVTFNL